MTEEVSYPALYLEAVELFESVVEILKILTTHLDTGEQLANVRQLLVCLQNFADEQYERQQRIAGEL